MLLVAAAFFAAAETALFALSPGQLYRLEREGGRLGAAAGRLMRDPGGVLTTVLLWTNVAHILYFVLSAVLVLEARRLDAHGRIVGAALWVGTFLLMVLLGEVVPKTAAFLWPQRLAGPAAGVLAVLVRVNRPVQRLLMAGVIEPLIRLLAPRRGRGGEVTAEELAALLALSQKRGLIGADETELIQEVLELTDLKAGDIMVPRVDVVACAIEEPPGEVLERIRHRQLTKLPVCEGDLDHVVGMVYAKRLLADPPPDLRQALTPVQFVPESAPLERVLMQLRAAHSQLAIVVDEYGGTAGLITLEDILEEIVGDIPDAREARRAPPVQQVGPGEWLVDGDLPIHEWAEAFPGDLTSARFHTVGGLAVSLLGHIPRVGDSTAYRNLGFTIEAVRRRRVSLLRVRLKEPAP